VQSAYKPASLLSTVTEASDRGVQVSCRVLVWWHAITPWPVASPDAALVGTSRTTRACYWFSCVCRETVAVCFADADALCPAAATGSRACLRGIRLAGSPVPAAVRVGEHNIVGRLRDRVCPTEHRGPFVRNVKTCWDTGRQNGVRSSQVYLSRSAATVEQRRLHLDGTGDDFGGRAAGVGVGASSRRPGGAGRKRR
jgi:hypothetical protein